MLVYYTTESFPFVYYYFLRKKVLLKTLEFKMVNVKTQMGYLLLVYYTTESFPFLYYYFPAKYVLLKDFRIPNRQN